MQRILILLSLLSLPSVRAFGKFYFISPSSSYMLTSGKWEAVDEPLSGVTWREGTRISMSRDPMEEVNESFTLSSGKKVWRWRKQRNSESIFEKLSRWRRSLWILNSIKKRELIGGGGGGGGARWDRGMRPKKAYISKTTEPNLKNEYVL